jgi:hypothetical protein
MTAAQILERRKKNPEEMWIRQQQNSKNRQN